jgi:hypothetical protein
MYAKCRNKVPLTWYHCNLSHHQGIVIHWKFNKADQILTKSGCPHSTQQVHCSDGYARLGHRNACMRSHHPRLRQEEQTKRASPMFARLHAFISRKQLTERVEVSTKDTGVFTHHYAESKSNTWRDTPQEIIQTRISAAMCTAKSQYSPSRHAISKAKNKRQNPRHYCLKETRGQMYAGSGHSRHEQTKQTTRTQPCPAKRKGVRSLMNPPLKEYTVPHFHAIFCSQQDVLRFPD